MGGSYGGRVCGVGWGGVSHVVSVRYIVDLLTRFVMRAAAAPRLRNAFSPSVQLIIALCLRLQERRFKPLCQSVRVHLQKGSLALLWALGWGSY